MTVPDTAQLLFSIFVSDLLPVFVIAAVGFVLARYLAVDARPVARLTFHALVPALVFNVLITSTLGGVAFFQMTAFYALVVVAAGLMGWTATRILRLDRAATS